MAYIYKIINQINGKIYVGKTMLSVEERFKEHKRDSKRERCKDRPLYKAMNKYGTENFFIETIEECSSEQVNEREIFWIEKLNTYHNGYNATIGGDGKAYLDYDLICDTYIKTQNTVETAKICGCCVDSVRNILRERNIPIASSSQVNKNKYGKAVDQYSLNDEFIQTFPSTLEAARALGKVTSTSTSKGAGGHISDVCKNRRKTAYGYKWKWHTDN